MSEFSNTTTPWLGAHNTVSNTAAESTNDWMVGAAMALPAVPTVGDRDSSESRSAMRHCDTADAMCDTEAPSGDGASEGKDSSEGVPPEWTSTLT